MKIIYYSPHPGLNLMSTSGYGTHMREMIKAFRELGHEVIPVIMGGTDDSAMEHSSQGAKGTVKNLAKKIIGKRLWRTLKDIQILRFDRRAKSALLEQVEKHQPDLIYERCSYMQVSGVDIARKKGIKHVMEINSPYVEEAYYLEGAEGYLKQKAYALEAEQARKTDRILVVSSALKDYYVTKYNIEPSEILVIPNAINPSDIHVDINRQQEIIAEYNLEDNIVLGYVGSIFEWHGIDLLVDVFADLKYDDAKLLIVGGGELLDTIKKRAALTNKSKDIIFTNRIPHEEVYDYIGVMDICVMAKSNWYGSPVKIFEYGALGKAIIAPDTVPVRDVMNDGEHGLLVNADIEKIKNAMMTFIKSTAKRLALGKAFNKKIIEQHTWIQNAKKVLRRMDLDS